jgi:sporulation integral membrane protein YtvI
MSFKTLIFVALGLAFLYGLFTVGFPFLLAIVVAISIEPANRLLIKWLRVNRFVAATLTSTLFILFILSVLFLIGLKIFTEMSALIQRMPGYIRHASEFIQNDLMDQTRGLVGQLSPVEEQQLNEFIQQGADQLTSAISRLADIVGTQAINLAGLLSNLFIFFLVFMVAVYLFAYSLPVLKRSFLSMFAEDSQDKVDRVLQDLRGSIFGFMKAQLILSTLTYILSLIGLLILDVNFAMAVALLIVIVDILPILGTGSFIVPWAIYNLIIGNVYLGVGLIILFLALTVFRRIVEPKILGDSVGIGALPALVSLYVGFKIVGVVGLFLGPIVVIVYQAMRKVGLLQIKIKLE